MGRPAIVDRRLAKRLRDDGWTLQAIGDYFGVSAQSIMRAVDADYRARVTAASKNAIERKRVPCESCGQVRVWAHYGPDSPNRSPDGRHLCTRCRGAIKATTVRTDTLRCGRCHEWKPDADFPRGQGLARRKRHTICRGCQAAVKREWRWANAKPCRNCGGPRGADSDYYSDRQMCNRTGLCLACYRKSRSEAA